MPGRARRNLTIAVALFAAVGILLAPRAAAHGDLASADPAEGARLDDVPSDVRLTFTEPPAAGALLTVTDGCDAEISGEPTIDGAALSASVSTDEAQPGRWTMTYRFISDVDGHQSRGKLTFTVAGKPKCLDPGEKGDDGPQLGANPTPLTRERTGGKGDSSFPWAVVVGGGLVVIVGGLLLRRVV